MHPGNTDLVAFIRETIRQRGPVSFQWFMEQALYHPELGYYSSGKCAIGRRGDYFTNVSVGPLFGRLLAAQFAEMWEALGRPGDFTIVEQGAHHGEFAGDVLEEARKRMPAFFPALRYSVIEPFPILEARQKERLRDFMDKVTWRQSLGDLEPFTGVHFSNELLDSMPVRLVSREGNGDWRERLVDSDGDGFLYITRPVAEEKLRQHLEKLPRDGETLHETEVNLGALEWIEDVARKLIRGFVLAIDYGYPRDEFYTAARTTGTLQCRAEHRAVISPLAEIGQADITAHVDWTSLAERGEESGLELIGFTDQHHFITGLLTRRPPQESERRALQTLLHPELLGTRFQFLALGKNVSGREVSGFRFAHGELRGEHVSEIAQSIRFVLEAVLQLELSVGGEPVAGGDVRAPEIVSPRRGAAGTVRHVAEELLVPAHGAEELRREFVFRLQVIGECIGIGETWNLKARLEKFRPQLPVVPGKADILREDAFVVIADVTAERQGRRRFLPEIGTVAGGNAKGPHLVRPKTEPPAQGRMVEVSSRDGPRLGPGRERRILDFRRVIEKAKPSCHRNARGVTRSPDHGMVFVFFRGRADIQELVIVGRGFVLDRSYVFIGEGRVDERVVPGEMARDPITDHRGKLAGLEIEAAIFPRREADRVFV